MSNLRLELEAADSIARMSLDQLCALPVEDLYTEILNHDPEALNSALLSLEKWGVAAKMDVHRLAWALASNIGGAAAFRAEANRPGQRCRGYRDRWPSGTAWPTVWSVLVAPLNCDEEDDSRPRTLLSELALSVACEQRQDWQMRPGAPIDTAAANRAFDFLYDRDSMKVLRFCRGLPSRVEGPDWTASEAWSQVFRDCWSAEATHRFLGVSSIARLVCKVARNRNVDAYRDQKKFAPADTARFDDRDENDDQLSPIMLVPDRRPGAYATLMGKQLGSRLRECMGRLPAKRQIVAEMVWFQELSAKRVSQLLRVTEPAISQHLKEARALVGRCLKERGFSVP